MRYKISLACINTPPESFVHVRTCMELGAVGQSAYVEKLENALCRYTGAGHAIVTSSGTMADAVAMAAMRETFGYRRVVVPALTFIAQANAARFAGLEIAWCDVNPDWTLDWAKAERVSAAFICYTDLMGRLTTPPLGPHTVEDACEAFGSEINGQKAGRFGTLGTFSFFISHTVTTGEGGAVLTDNSFLADLCRSLRSHGRASDTDALDKFRFPRRGFNAKMSGLTAAYGLGVMQHIAGYVERRRENFALMNRLMDYQWPVRATEKIAPHGYPVQFAGEKSRDLAMKNLLGAGIECRKFFSCIPTMEAAYQDSGHKLGDFPVAEAIGRCWLYVPCHQNMSAEDVKYVVAEVRQQDGLIHDYRAELERLAVPCEF